MNEVENTRRELLEAIQKTDRNTIELPSIENPDTVSPLKIQLYYIYLAQRVDLWEAYQRKAIGTLKDETVLKWLHKEMKNITPEDKKEMAYEAFKAALAMKDQPKMSDIMKGDDIQLETKDIIELIEKELFEVLKAAIEKPLLITRKMKRDIQCQKYHRAERILHMLGIETSTEHLELGDIIDYMIDSGMPDSKIERFLEVFSGEADINSVRSLLIHGKEKTAEKLYTDGKIATNDAVMIIALEYKCFGFLLMYMKQNNYELTDDSLTPQLFKKIVEMLSEDLPHTEFYLYVLRKYFIYLPYESAREFAEKLDDWLGSQNLRVPFVFSNVNPVKICVLLVELLIMIKKTNDSLEKWIETIIKDLLSLSSLLIKTITDEEELQEIFMDVDLDGRPMIQTAAFNDVLSVFNHESITSVTDRIWAGPYVSKGVPDTSQSMIVSNLIHSPFSRKDLFYRNLSEVFSRDYMSYPTHNFQYVTWRDGLQARYVVESLFYIFLFIYTYYLFYNVTSHARAAYEIIRNASDSESTISLVELVEINSNFREMADYILITHTYLLLLFIVNFRHIFLYIFSELTDRKIASMYAELTLDALVNIGIIIYNYTVRYDFLKILDYTKNVHVFAAKTIEFWDNNDYIVPLFSFFVIIIFVRTLNTLEVHNIIGPFIEMMKQMVMRIGTFSLFFAILLFFFAMVGALYIPYSIEEYRSLYRAVVTLFQTSIGVFDMNLMKSEFKAEMFTIIYVLVFNILLLNLLIAILTQVYTDVSEQADTLYVSNLIVLHSLYAPHEQYSALINSFPPLNMVFGTITLPLYLFSSQESCTGINNVFLKIEYFMTFIIIFAFYVAMELIAIGFCYLKVLIHQFLLIFTGNDFGTCRRITNFVIFFFIGYILLIVMLLSDLYYFILHSFKHQGEIRYTEEHRDPMSKRVLTKLCRFIDDVSKKYEAMPWEDLRQSLYELCAIDIISQSNSPAATPRADDENKIQISPGVSPSAGKSKYKNYKNFRITSEMIKNCSNVDDGIIVDILTVRDLVENYMFLARMQKRQSLLINKDIRKTLKHDIHSYEIPQTAPQSANSSIVHGDKSGAALISLRVDNLENANEGQYLVMKLFTTFNLDKYTNALILFKCATANHWLAKNALLMGQDIKQVTRKMAKTTGVSPRNKINLDSIKTEKKKRGSDSQIKEDVTPIARTGENTIVNGSFTMQELDDIMKNVEEAVSPTKTPAGQNSLLVVPPVVQPKSPSQAMFKNDAKF